MKIESGINGLLSSPRQALFDWIYKDNTFIISLTQTPKSRIVNILSENEVNCHSLWVIYSEFEELLEVIDGYFLDLKNITFIGVLEASKYQSLAKQYELNQLESHKSKNILSHSFCVYCNEIINASTFEKWHDIKDQLKLIHPMMLYSASAVQMPVDMKLAFTIESFRPLFECAVNYDPGFNAFVSNNKCYNNEHLKNALKPQLKYYGKLILSSEMKYVNQFCSALVDSRNRIAHVDGQGHEVYLDGSESALYVSVLFIIYRIELLSMLSISYQNIAQCSVESMIENTAYLIRTRNLFLQKLEKRYIANATKNQRKLIKN